MRTLHKAWSVLTTCPETGERLTPRLLAVEIAIAALFIAGVPCAVLLWGASLGVAP